MAGGYSFCVGVCSQITSPTEASYWFKTQSFDRISHNPLCHQSYTNFAFRYRFALIFRILQLKMSLFAISVGHGGIAAQQASGGHASSDDGTPCYRGNNP